MKKKILGLSLVLALAFSMSITANAATTLQNNLTAEQIAVMRDYQGDTAKSVTVTSGSDHKLVGALATTTYRGSFHRGTVLMWSEDFVSWTTNGSSISASSAWQDGGYIFPNIINLSGIKKYLTGSSSVTYRAKKTLGAGVVTPWGDVSVYNYDYTDYLQANANGTLDVYQ
jgi:hypothetical protein